MPVIDVISKTTIAQIIEQVEVGTIVVTKEPDYITTYRVVDVAQDVAWCQYRSQVCIREDRTC